MLTRTRVCPLSRSPTFRTVSNGQATARLVVTAAIAVATFYVEAHAANHSRPPGRRPDILF